MNRKKVLVLGRYVSDFLGPLFREIQERFPVDVYVFENREKSKKEDDLKRSFKERWHFRSDLKQYRVTELLAALFTGTFLRKLAGTRNLKEALRFALIKKEVHEKFSEVDVFNFQFLSTEILYLIDFIPGHKKIILSYWGSDLFHNNNDFLYTQHKAAVERADRVILHTPEMQHVFLSKFGRHLKNKTEVFLLVSKPETLSKIAASLSEKKCHTGEFCTKYQIPESATLITVGHSAHELDYHIGMVNALAELPASSKEKLFLVLPMTYGNVGDYTDRVEQACIKSEIPFRIFREFLPEKDLISLRLASELMLRMSEFDAFSLSVCETMCAGNLVVCGTWLPYGKMRVAGIYFREAETFEQLPGIVTEFLKNRQTYLSNCAGNTGKVIDFFTGQDSPKKMADLILN